MNDENKLDDWGDFRKDADKGREPELLPGQMGRRLVSTQALLERIEKAFIEEYADHSPILEEADTPTKRLKLVLGTVDYVLAVESIQLSGDEKAKLIGKAYSNLFGYGPLDPLFLDERVTTISLDGPNKASVRYGHGDLVSVGPIFQDEGHLRRILRRLLIDAGADLRDDQPFIETGLNVDGRPVCINLISPPLAFDFNADIRVHPQNVPSFSNLVESGFLTAKAVTFLKALAQSPHGFVIVGDTESGKTTLLSALAQFLPNPHQAISVERAGELRLPQSVKRLMTIWPSKNEPGTSFGAQIGVALAQKPDSLILDEVRADEPETIAPLLREVDSPRQIWSFRGPFDAKRLRNALSMLARRADFAQGEAMVDAMYHRLAFVLTVWRVRGQIKLYSVAEWQFRNSDYPDYVLLMKSEDGELKLTGERPALPLDLPDDFWG
jgi:Flp pilus assembly CpaF family ATPase